MRLFRLQSVILLTFGLCVCFQVRAGCQIRDPDHVLDSLDAFLGHVPFEKAVQMGDKVQSRENTSACTPPRDACRIQHFWMSVTKILSEKPLVFEVAYSSTGKIVLHQGTYENNQGNALREYLNNISNHRTNCELVMEEKLSGEIREYRTEDGIGIEAFRACFTGYTAGVAKGTWCRDLGRNVPYIVQQEMAEGRQIKSFLRK